MGERLVHAFGEDALGELDGTAIAELIRAGELTPEDAAHQAAERAGRVDPMLHAIAEADYANVAEPKPGPLRGVPSFIKDNTPVPGLPTRHGSAAVPGTVSPGYGAFAKQFISTGMTVLGKTRLPEFGLNATTEFVDEEPTRNPWNTGYSAGGSSGGAAALVASGVVPIAHGNDGGGSIRIPAACCGLVGLKPSRGRTVASELAKMPINLVVDGVLTRTVRDSAAFLAAAEGYRRSPKLPPLGHIRESRGRKLRIGLVLDPVVDTEICPQTRAAVEATAARLEKLGHTVEPIRLPFGDPFVTDFLTYWGMLAFLLSALGKHSFGKEFDPARLTPLTTGLRRIYQRGAHRTPGTLYRLARAKSAYAAMFRTHHLVLSPVLGHVTPELGHLRPDVPVAELIERLKRYVAFTPLANVTGAPALSLPAGLAEEGVPIGVQFSAADGDERSLLEIGYELEDAMSWRTIAEQARRA
ncbi:amidase [Sciscionella sediminilitoris]|uniref:amidase n=1 Tax=Sciscionella sediminilitoris TaxID=1445613 RepID=UPI0004DF4E0B|nr:amidase [Sciscionella sp. SE31]